MRLVQAYPVTKVETATVSGAGLPVTKVETVIVAAMMRLLPRINSLLWSQTA